MNAPQRGWSELPQMRGNEPSPKITAATCVRALLDLSVPLVLMCHVCLDKNVCSVSETPNVISC